MKRGELREYLEINAKKRKTLKSNYRILGGGVQCIRRGEEKYPKK